MTQPDDQPDDVPPGDPDPGHLLSADEWATVQADAAVYAADSD